MSAKFTPGPWHTKREGFSTVYVQASIGGGWIQEVAACGPTEGGRNEQEANARLIESAPALLEALQAYQAAESMPLYPLVEWSPPERTYDPSYGGGDCSVHGRYYGRCNCCEGDYKKAIERAEKTARIDRNDALRMAQQKARAAIAKALGEQP